MRTAQCGSMEAEALSFVLRAAGGSMGAEALSFVLRAAGSEHHQSSTRRVFTYVVGGRVGMNDTCYFSLDMKKLVIPPHPTRPLAQILRSICVRQRW